MTYMIKKLLYIEIHDRDAYVEFNFTVHLQYLKRKKFKCRKNRLKTLKSIELY